MVEKNIALIGFMGSGKSSVGQSICEKLNINHIDTDFLIEKNMKMKISEIFKKYGEEKFREIEKDTIKGLKDNKNCIISCGGGVILNKENIINLRNNFILILLEASAEVILDRIKTDTSRPILSSNMDLKTIKKIKLQRKEAYFNSADIIIYTDNKSISDITKEILTILRKDI